MSVAPKLPVFSTLFPEEPKHIDYFVASFRKTLYLFSSAYSSISCWNFTHKNCWEIWVKL